MNRTPNDNADRNRAGNRIRQGLWALGVLALLGLSSPALAESGGHAGIVLAKDGNARTLTLANGTVLHVSARTIITGVEGQRIGFDEIPAAVATGDGGFEVDGNEGITYEAEHHRGSARASRIQVLADIPQ